MNLVFTLLLFLAVWLCGDLVQRVLRKEATLSGALAWGTVFILAVFHLLAYPLYKLHASFSALFYSFSAVMVVLLAAAVYGMVRGKRLGLYGAHLKAVGRTMKARPWLTALCLAAAAVYVFAASRAWPNSDDTLYIPRAMEVLARNELHFTEAISWFGFAMPGFTNATDASTMEFLRAYLSRLSGIEVLVICRVCLNILLSVVHFAAAFTAMDSVTRGRGGDPIYRRMLVFLLYTIFQLLSLQENSVGMWIIRYVWQGKAALIAIVFPMVLAACADLIEGMEQVNWRHWAGIACVLLAGMAVSIVGLFLPAILYFCCGVAFLVADRFRSFKKIILPAILAAVPVVVIGLISYLEIATANQQYFEMEACSWLRSFTQSTEWCQAALLIVSVLYFAKRGTRTQKIVCVFTPLALLVTFLNPLLIGPVSTYVTTPMVYFRLFWLLPVYFTPALAAADWVERAALPNKKLLLSAALALAVTVGGYGVESVFLARMAPQAFLSLFYPVDNPYHITDYVVRLGDRILEDWTGEDRPRVVHVALEAFEFRQYSADYDMLAGYREDQRALQTEKIPGTDMTEREFFETMGQMEDAEALREMLQRLDADYYISTNADAITDRAEFEAAGFTYLERVDQHTFKYGDEWFTLWRV